MEVMQEEEAEDVRCDFTNMEWRITELKTSSKLNN
jgi:hypothetical protein